MNCFFCGREIMPGDSYCRKCGSDMIVKDTFRDEKARPFTPRDSTGLPPERNWAEKDTLVTAPADIMAPPAAPYKSPLAIDREARDAAGKSNLDRVKGWNWGAFIFGWIWCFGNGLFKAGFVALIATVFQLGFIVNIFLGIGGNEMLWKEKRFRSVEEFKGIQRRWTIAAFLLIFAVIGLIFIAAILGSTQ
jgi:hypothetical protein